MTKPIQSSTGGDALREAKQERVLNVLGTMRVAAELGLPIGVRAFQNLFTNLERAVNELLAPPLIKQEAETPQGTQCCPICGDSEPHSHQPWDVERERYARPIFEMMFKHTFVHNYAGLDPSGTYGWAICWNQRKYKNAPDYFFEQVQTCWRVFQTAWIRRGEMFPEMKAATIQACGQVPAVVAPVGDSQEFLSGVLEGLRRGKVIAESSVSGPSEGLAAESPGPSDARDFAIEKAAIKVAKKIYPLGMQRDIREALKALIITSVQAALAKSAAGTSKQETMQEPAKEDL